VAAARFCRSGSTLVADETQQRLIKMRGRLVKHARSYWLPLVERRLTRRLFGAIVQRLGTLSGPVG
jgi:hypothetical protein